MQYNFSYLICMLSIVATAGGRLYEQKYSCPDQYKVDFIDSMEFFVNDEFSKQRLIKQKLPLIEFFKDLFEKNSLTKLQPNKDSLIPKKLHLIWVGPKTPPPVFEKCIESAQQVLFDWEIKLWTDEDIPGLHLENQKFYDEETNYGAKADILRYELLYRFGGVYMDIDFIFLKSLNILNHTYNFYACCMPSLTDDVVANGVIGCIPKHPILRKCVEKIAENRHHSNILQRTGPFLFQQAIYDVAQQNFDRAVVLPKSFFFPLDPHERFATKTEVLRKIKAEAFAVHYWADSWDENPTMAVNVEY